MTETLNLKRFILRYCAIPTNYNRPHNAIVEAEDAESAKALLKERLGDGNGVRNYVIDNVKEYTPSQVKGRVISLKEGTL